MVWSWESGIGTDCKEKVATSSRVMEMGRIAETEKKESQNLEQIQECIMLSEIWPQPKAQPLFFAPNLDLVHQ